MIPAPIEQGASADRRWGAVDIAACRRYVLDRQTADGAFCFYGHSRWGKTEPVWGVVEPNAPDTLAAIAVLQRLETPLPDADSWRRWLWDRQDGAGGYPTRVIAYSALCGLRLLEAPPVHDPRPFLEAWAASLQAAGDGSTLRPSWLKDAVHWAELWQHHVGRFEPSSTHWIAAMLDRLRNGDGGYGAPGGSLYDTSAALRLARIAGLQPPNGILAYIRGCEGPPHGFNVAARAVSSNLETQHAGVTVLNALGAPIGFPALVRQYVESCQSAAGGFGRMPHAIPRLTDTRLAVEVLSLLSRAVE